jgi:hypothetical protein
MLFTVIPFSSLMRSPSNPMQFGFTGQIGEKSMAYAHTEITGR